MSVFLGCDCQTQFTHYFCYAFPVVFSAFCYAAPSVISFAARLNQSAWSGDGLVFLSLTRRFSQRFPFSAILSQSGVAQRMNHSFCCLGANTPAKVWAVDFLVCLITALSNLRTARTDILVNFDDIPQKPDC
ncbi:hypothetical protein RA28_07705 [Ruegeria sp. ANG-S4]|uniref:hypothetical protein n=1 Tax=Ruegeria sp. ANG-S4 TaxID=1577904 RepID=UPI0005832EF0|nr:hypothetical protein [Ruegeria sp. ANG-S4]KIC45606.1 hypothetical protein RA28_07705 [Ruegeria sp. ANG-S4]